MSTGVVGTEVANTAVLSSDLSDPSVRRLHVFHKPWTEGPIWLFFLRSQPLHQALLYDKMYTGQRHTPYYISEYFVGPLDHFLWYNVFHTNNILMAEYMVRVKAPIQLSNVLQHLVDRDDILWLEWIVKQSFFELTSNGYQPVTLPIPVIDDALIEGYETAYFCLHHWSGRSNLFRDPVLFMQRYMDRLKQMDTMDKEKAKTKKSSKKADVWYPSETSSECIKTMVRLLVPRYVRMADKSFFECIVSVKSTRLLLYVLNDGEEGPRQTLNSAAMVEAKGIFRDERRMQILIAIIHRCIAIDWDDGFEHFVQYHSSSRSRLSSSSPAFPSVSLPSNSIDPSFIDAMFIHNSAKCYRVVSRKFPVMKHVPSEAAIQSAIQAGHEYILLDGGLPEDYSVTNETFMVALTSTPNIFDWAYKRVNRHFRLEQHHVDTVIRSAKAELICRFFILTDSIQMVKPDHITYLARYGCREGLYALHYLGASVYNDQLLESMANMRPRLSYSFVGNKANMGVYSEIVIDIFKYGKNLDPEVVQEYIERSSVGNVPKYCDSIRVAMEYLERLQKKRAGHRSKKPAET